MSRDEIKKALLDKGYTLTKLAKEYGTRSEWVSTVISGRGNSEPLERAIAKIIGKTYAEVWR